MMHKTFAAIAVLGCSILLAGCGSRAQKTFTYDAPVGKPIAVDIENPRGDIVVRGDGADGTVRLLAKRYVDEPHEHPADDVTHRNDEWNEGDLRVEFVEQDGGSVLRVRPGDHNEALGVRVDMYIHMPTLDGAEIRNANGDVILVDFRGATRVHNQFGAIDIRTSHPLSRDMELTTTAGNIYVQAPPGSNAEVDLRTLDGTLAYEDEVDRTSGPHTNDDESLTAFLGSGGNDLICRTDDGDIYVWVMEDPLAYTRTFRPKWENPMSWFFKNGSRRHSRELPDDHPEITDYAHPDESGY